MAGKTVDQCKSALLKSYCQFKDGSPKKCGSRGAGHLIPHICSPFWTSPGVEVGLFVVSRIMERKAYQQSIQKDADRLSP